MEELLSGDLRTPRAREFLRSQAELCKLPQDRDADRMVAAECEAWSGVPADRIIEWLSILRGRRGRGLIAGLQNCIRATPADPPGVRHDREMVAGGRVSCPCIKHYGEGFSATRSVEMERAKWTLRSCRNGKLNLDW